MQWFHATTEETIRSIRAVGLRKGTFVYVELADARRLASLRSQWNKQRPVVLTGPTPISKIKHDRTGTAEAVLLADCRSCRIVPCDFAGETAEPLSEFELHAVGRIFTAHKARTFNRDLRYPVQYNAEGKRCCRWCCKPVPRGRMSYCGDQCQIEVDIRSSAVAARRHVFERDKGVCRQCGTDTELLRRALGYAAYSLINSERYGAGSHRRLHAHFRITAYEAQAPLRAVAAPLGFSNVTGHFWEADHIVELSDGGSGGLDNLQTLCVPCHKRKTAANAGRRALERRDRRKPLLALAG